jgi:23S rRNA (pseudouridine1915-N3)-methyltransferase
MRVTVAAVGRVRDGPIADLIQGYARRLPWDLAFREVAEGRQAARRKAAEAEALLAAAPDGALIVALDERGKTLTSEELAQWIGRRRDGGEANLAFLIGGADGLDARVLDRSDLVLSLGRMTWPHLMARLMLVEQLYRAHTILTGHPYHRV